MESQSADDEKVLADEKAIENRRQALIAGLRQGQEPRPDGKYLA